MPAAKKQTPTLDTKGTIFSLVTYLLYQMTDMAWESLRIQAGWRMWTLFFGEEVYPWVKIIRFIKKIISGFELVLVRRKK